MNACPTGCGWRVAEPEWFCEACLSTWIASPERKRFFAVTGFEREQVALVDFCNRVRAERQNGGRNDP